jgi:aminoglycoside phosphotransferase (APT) family kinase protein
MRLPLDVDDLCRRFGAQRIGEPPVPWVWQHGDLTPFNLRWDGSRHSLVDWESARPGPALCDLLYLLLHWQWPDVPRVGAAPVEVLDAVFLSEAGHLADTVSSQVRRYCAALGVDGVAVPSLLLRMLSQQALDRADRIRAIGLDPAEDRNLYADLFCRVTEADVPALSWAAP